MVRRFILTTIAATILTTGATSARWPGKLDLDWFELPDARPIECEIRDGSDVECFATSLEFKKFKKHLRKLWNRKSRKERLELVELSPWRKDGELRRMSAAVGSTPVELVFNESRRAVAVITVPFCLDGSELGAVEPDDLDSEPELIERVHPSFPVYARQRGVKGFGVFQGIIRSTGLLTDLCAVAMVPTGEGFEESALEALSQWRWRPGRIGGQAVDTQVVVVVHWGIRAFR